MPRSTKSHEDLCSTPISAAAEPSIWIPSSKPGLGMDSSPINSISPSTPGFSYSPMPMKSSYSCVGVQRGGHVEIIANDQGHRITPLWVSFTDDERVLIKTSTTLSVRQLRMLVQLQGFKFFASPMNPPLLLSPTVLTRKAGSRRSSCMILVVEPSMFHCS